MKRMMVAVLVTLVLPVAAAAQVEIGVDGGLEVRDFSEGERTTAFSVPNSTLRIGFPRDGITFETLLNLQVVHWRDTDAVAFLTPGFNLALGEGGAYLRGEVPLVLVSEGDNDIGVGAAVGVKKPLADTPVSVRGEVGFNRLFDAELNRFRALVGLSVRIGG